MKIVFADTSFYIALVNPHDALHTRATVWAGAFRGEILTTEFVLLETGNWLATSHDRAVFVQLMQALQNDAARACCRWIRSFSRRVMNAINSARTKIGR